MKCYCRMQRLKQSTSRLIEANQIPCKTEAQEFTHYGLILINILFINYYCKSVNFTQSIRLSILLLCIFWLVHAPFHGSVSLYIWHHELDLEPADVFWSGQWGKYLEEKSERKLIKYLPNQRQQRTWYKKQQCSLYTKTYKNTPREESLPYQGFLLNKWFILCHLAASKSLSEALPTSHVYILHSLYFQATWYCLVVTSHTEQDSAITIK